MVSRTQYASLVSAIVVLFHLIWRWRGVFSRRGGRGKEWTFSLGLGAMAAWGGEVSIGWRSGMGRSGFVDLGRSFESGMDDGGIET